MKHARTLLTLSVAFVLFGASACTYKPRTAPPNSGPGTANSARSYLEGRWSLVSFTVYPADGAPIEMKGTGTLVYDDYANLSMDIVPDAASAALLEKVGIPLQNGKFSMAGRTIVDMQNRTLSYVPEGQPSVGYRTGPMAVNRLRHWQVAGDTLTLTTKDDNGKALSVGTWQKQ
jgi:hypothetical protein